MENDLLYGRKKIGFKVLSLYLFSNRLKIFINYYRSRHDVECTQFQCVAWFKDFVFANESMCLHEVSLELRDMCCLINRVTIGIFSTEDRHFFKTRIQLRK